MNPNRKREIATKGYWNRARTSESPEAYKKRMYLIRDILNYADSEAQGAHDLIDEEYFDTLAQQYPQLAYDLKDPALLELAQQRNPDNFLPMAQREGYKRQLRRVEELHEKIKKQNNIVTEKQRQALIREQDELQESYNNLQLAEKKAKESVEYDYDFLLQLNVSPPDLSVYPDLSVNDIESPPFDISVTLLPKIGAAIHFDSFLSNPFKYMYRGVRQIFGGKSLTESIQGDIIKRGFIAPPQQLTSEHSKSNVFSPAEQALRELTSLRKEIANIEEQIRRDPNNPDNENLRHHIIRRQNEIKWIHQRGHGSFSESPQRPINGEGYQVKYRWDGKPIPPPSITPEDRYKHPKGQFNPAEAAKHWQRNVDIWEYREKEIDDQKSIVVNTYNALIKDTSNASRGDGSAGEEYEKNLQPLLAEEIKLKEKIIYAKASVKYWSEQASQQKDHSRSSSRQNDRSRDSSADDRKSPVSNRSSGNNRSDDEKWRQPRARQDSTPRDRDRRNPRKDSQENNLTDTNTIIRDNRRRIESHVRSSSASDRSTPPRSTPSPISPDNFKNRRSPSSLSRDIT